MSNDSPSIIIPIFSPDLKVCKYNLSPDCLRIDDSKLFHGRCCNPCNLARARTFYVENRDRLIVRSKENYHRKRFELKQLAKN